MKPATKTWRPVIRWLFKKTTKKQQHASQYVRKNTNTRKVLGGLCVLHVKFCYRDTSCSHLGSKHGCWIDNRWRANLQWSVHAKILMKKVTMFTKKYFAHMCYVTYVLNNRVWNLLFENLLQKRYSCKFEHLLINLTELHRQWSRFIPEADTQLEVVANKRG